ncbi:nitrate/nitrite transporter NrtS [Lentilactobacillus kisonensis]
MEKSPGYHIQYFVGSIYFLPFINHELAFIRNWMIDSRWIRNFKSLN